MAAGVRAAALFCLLCAAGPLRAADLQGDLALLSSVVDSVERMRALLNLKAESPKWDAKLARQLTVFRGAREAVQASLDGSPEKNRIRTVMRVDRTAFGAGGDAWTGLATPFANARDTLMLFGNVEGFRAKLLAALGNDTAARTRLTSPLTQIHLVQLDSGMARNEEKLRRYKIKYGPASARLNLLETVVNYGLLQGVPGFRSTEAGPGPLELITSYSTAYFMLYRPGAGKFPEEPMLASVFEGGLRWYFFAKGWGGEGLAGRFLKPAYCTAGLAVAGGRSGFFKWPFEAESRLGAFASWGDIKLAVIGVNDWDKSEILLSRQFQFIPYLF